jgi:dienelactone hydrolase
LRCRYCFGGTTVLELARSGAEIGGVVSFHGGLSTPEPSDAKKIRAKVLVLHGADDPNVPPQEVAAFEQEMRQTGVDWQLIAYGGAVHAFTDWSAGNVWRDARLLEIGRCHASDLGDILNAVSLALMLHFNRAARRACA